MLGAIPFQPNEVVLHTDRSLLPNRRRAWASWNFHLQDEPVDRSTVTYHMNRLQSLRSDPDFCVTLNRTEAIDPDSVIRVAALRPSSVHSGRPGRAEALERGQRRRAHPLLRRLLGLRLPRGRCGLGLACLCSIRQVPPVTASAALRRLGPPSPPRTRRARVPLPALHELPRPGRAAGGPRPSAPVVGASRRPPALVLGGRTTSRRRTRWSRSGCLTRRSHLRTPASTRSASTTALTPPESTWRRCSPRSPTRPGASGTRTTLDSLRHDGPTRAFHVSPFLGMDSAVQNPPHASPGDTPARTHREPPRRSR